MKIKLLITRLAGAKEFVLDIERGGPDVLGTPEEQLRWASEDARRFGMALEAIRRSPESADAIAEDALEG